MAYIKLRDYEIIEIRKYIKSVFGEVCTGSRLSELVYKRKIIITELYSLGFGKSDIARILNRNHATIHYVINNDFVCKDFNVVKEKYKDFKLNIFLFLIENKIPLKKKLV